MKKRNSIIALREGVRRYAKLIDTGKVLSIDPSTASTSSLPGYALIDKGKLIEAGVLDISTTGPLYLRLQKIHFSLLKFFDNIDLLILEDVAVRPLRTKNGAVKSGKTYMNPKTIHSLAQSVGIFKGTFPVGTPVLMVSPLVWYSYKRKYNWNLQKGDYEDAIAMWLTVKKIREGK